MYARQTFTEVCTFQRKSFTYWSCVHSCLMRSCSQTCASASHSPCRSSELHPAALAQPSPPALCPDREAFSSSVPPSASAAGWDYTDVDSFGRFLLRSCLTKCHPVSPNGVHRCHRCTVWETGQAVAGPPRRHLSAPFCQPWQQWSDQVMSGSPHIRLTFPPAMLVFTQNRSYIWLLWLNVK